MNITLNGQEFEGVWITQSEAQDVPTQRGLLFGGNSWYGLLSYPEFDTLTDVSVDGKKYAAIESLEGTPTIAGSWYIWWKLIEKVNQKIANL